MTQLIGQKTLNYDKVVNMLANEHCRNEKLKGKIEELEKENLTLKKGNRKQNKSEVTENSYVTKPRPKATIEEEQQNELEDTFRLNYQLKAELTSLKEKSKVLQIEQENKKIENEIKALQEKLDKKRKKIQEIETTKSKPKDNNDSRNKHKRQKQKLNIIITGDSVLNIISENFNLNTRSAKVNDKPFPGATMDDFNDFIKPLARQKPNYIIFHAGTNNLKSDTPDRMSVICNPDPTTLMTQTL